MSLANEAETIKGILAGLGFGLAGFTLGTLDLDSLHSATKPFLIPILKSGTDFPETKNLSLNDLVLRALEMARVKGRAQVDRVLRYLAEQIDSNWAYQGEEFTGPFYAEDYQLAFNTLRLAFSGESHPFEVAFLEKYGTRNWSKACEDRAERVAALLRVTIPAKIETLSGIQLSLPLLVVVAENKNKQDELDFSKPPQTVKLALAAVAAGD